MENELEPVLMRAHKKGRARAAFQESKGNGGQAIDARAWNLRPRAKPATPRPAKPSAIIIQVDGSGTIGIGPLTVVSSEMVDRAVGAPSPTVTTYSSVIDQGVAKSSTNVVAPGLLVLIELNVAVASCVAVPKAVSLGSK